MRPGLKVCQDIEVPWQEMRDQGDLVVVTPKEEGPGLAVQRDGVGASFFADVCRCGNAVGHYPNSVSPDVSG